MHLNRSQTGRSQKSKQLQHLSEIIYSLFIGVALMGWDNLDVFSMDD